MIERQKSTALQAVCQYNLSIVNARIRLIIDQNSRRRHIISCCSKGGVVIDGRDMLHLVNDDEVQAGEIPRTYLQRESSPDLEIQPVHGIGIGNYRNNVAANAILLARRELCH